MIARPAHNQGRGSEECRQASAQALRRIAGWLALLVLTAAAFAAFTYARGQVPQPIVPHVFGASVLLGVLGGGFIGFVFGAAFFAPDASPLRTMDGGERVGEQARNRVRAGSAPLPYSYCDQHQAQTVRDWRRQHGGNTNPPPTHARPPAPPSPPPAPRRR